MEKTHIGRVPKLTAEERKERRKALDTAAWARKKSKLAEARAAKKAKKDKEKARKATLKKDAVLLGLAPVKPSEPTMVFNECGKQDMPTKMPKEFSTRGSPVGPRPRQTDNSVPLGNAPSYNMRV